MRSGADPGLPFGQRRSTKATEDLAFDKLDRLITYLRLRYFRVDDSVFLTRRDRHKADVNKLAYTVGRLAFIYAMLKLTD